MFLVQVQLFGTGSRYDLKILYQCGKRVETKVKVFGAISYVCRNYRGSREDENQKLCMYTIVNFKKGI